MVFPKGVPYGEEMVYQGSNEIKVYVKTLAEVSDPVILKFMVSYQICQEQPKELCFIENVKVIT
mgnify:CR=1 FL=1